MFATTTLRSSNASDMTPGPEKVTDDWAKGVCRIGQGAACCRYLVMGPGGWDCAKPHGQTRAMLDKRVAAGQLSARGDNCEGVAACP
jgi:hypothetical protein